MAISGTTPITAPVAPTSAGDTYASHIAEYGKGGYMSVADNATRDAIPEARRTYGMQVYVIATGVTYIMGPGLSNGEWSVVNRGPQIVNNIATLQALNGANIQNGTEFHARSASSIGDGGQDDFYYDSGSSASAVTGVVVVPADSIGRFLVKTRDNLRISPDLIITSGSGSPESVVTAKIGSLYLRTDGGANTTLYVKESTTGNTGWIAK